MGTNDSVDREYADPALGGPGTCGAVSCPATGLMQYLSGHAQPVPQRLQLGAGRAEGPGLLLAAAGFCPPYARALAVPAR